MILKEKHLNESRMKLAVSVTSCLNVIPKELQEYVPMSLSTSKYFDSKNKDVQVIKELMAKYILPQMFLCYWYF